MSVTFKDVVKACQTYPHVRLDNYQNWINQMSKVIAKSEDYSSNHQQRSYSSHANSSCADTFNQLDDTITPCDILKSLDEFLESSKDTSLRHFTNQSRLTQRNSEELYTGLQCLSKLLNLNYFEYSNWHILILQKISCISNIAIDCNISSAYLYTQMLLSTCKDYTQSFLSSLLKFVIFSLQDNSSYSQINVALMIIDKYLQYIHFKPDDISISNQLLLVCCWRTAKELSLIMGKLCADCIPLLHSTKEILSLSQILEIKDAFELLMLHSRHHGTFESAHIGFCQMVDAIYSQAIHSEDDRIVNKAARICKKIIKNKIFIRKQIVDYALQYIDGNASPLAVDNGLFLLMSCNIKEPDIVSHLDHYFNESSILVSSLIRADAVTLQFFKGLQNNNLVLNSVRKLTAYLPLREYDEDLVFLVSEQLWILNECIEFWYILLSLMLTDIHDTIKAINVLLLPKLQLKFMTSATAPPCIITILSHLLDSVFPIMHERKSREICLRQVFNAFINQLDTEDDADDCIFEKSHMSIDNHSFTVAMLLLKAYDHSHNKNQDIFSTTDSDLNIGYIDILKSTANRCNLSML
ncbi:hypothetical protein GJ496_008790 [Pomphorhynchus laevis]|nr:hypothetical protein GJ496_008790 [Pomphorhynchus laevis]